VADLVQIALYRGKEMAAPVEVVAVPFLLMEYLLVRVRLGRD
jgi:hypothetical protein